jgi:hypothetical protein
MNGIQATVTDITQKTQMLPVGAPRKKAIEAGAKVVTDAVGKQIAKENPSILRPFNSIGP